MPTEPFKMVLNATPEEVMRGVETLEKFCRERNVDDRSIHALMLSLEEIASNVVNHAYARDAQQTFRLTFQVTAEKVTVEVRDHGPAFDPLPVAKPVPEGEDDDRPEGGWGIELVRHSMDELHYLREGNENVLKMARSLTPREA